MSSKWKCPGCGLKFDAKEPPASIPVSVVRCPKCGDIAEQEGMMSEAEIRNIRDANKKAAPPKDMVEFTHGPAYMRGFIDALNLVLGEEG